MKKFFIFVVLFLSLNALAGEQKMKEISNQSAFDTVVALIEKNQSQKKWEGLKNQANKVSDWLKKHPLKSDFESFDPENKVAGFRVLRKKHFNVAKDIEGAPLLFGNGTIQPKDADVVMVEFVSYLSNGYVAYVDLRTGEILVVKVLIEG